MPKIDFEHRIVLTGFGVVAQAVLPILLDHLRVPLDRITVIDFSDRTQQLRRWLGPDGLRYVQERVTPHSLPRLLAESVSRGGLIIDLAWSIDFFDIAQWAHDNGVVYVNASVESWDPSGDLQPKSVIDKSLYARYVRALDLARAWKNASTAVLDQGSNPGLVSAFAKKALMDIAAKTLEETTQEKACRCRLESLVEARDYPRLARELGVRVIHCSEHDTQRPIHPKEGDEFVGTWCLEGMWEESIAPCEFGWGTHERTCPPSAVAPAYGPGNVILLPRMGMNTWIRSWVPQREIVGMAIPHGESFGLSHALTLREDGAVAYRPTVLYAYMPCGESLLSLHELRCRNYELHPRLRILAREIHDGSDTIGALVMGHRFQSWWTGSILSIEQARRLVPDVSATAVQVAAGVVAGVLWAVQNPTQGLCFPEDLPHEEVLRLAAPYLGEFVSEPADWNPLRGHRSFFPERFGTGMDWNDPWQFHNFLFRA